MELLIRQQWSVFIGLEIASLLFLVLFLVIRYALSKEQLGRLFLGLFMLCIILEAALAWFIYRKTGEIDTFQIVIAIFVIYACTFGINDFKKLDRFIKKHVGNWRGVELLTEEEKRKMAEAKNPKVIARKNRRWWYAHAAVFIIAHYFFWHLYGNQGNGLLHYLEDLSWFGEEDFHNAPFRGEMINSISRLWILVFVIDTIVSWSYTIFPAKKSG